MRKGLSLNLRIMVIIVIVTLTALLVFNLVKGSVFDLSQAGNQSINNTLGGSLK